MGAGLPTALAELARPWLRDGGKRFLWSLATVSAGNYGAIGLSFVISVVLTRALGAQDYGRFALLLTVSQVLVVLVSAWTLTGLVRYGAREHAERGTIAHTFWARAVLLIPAVGLATALLLAGAPLITSALGLAAAAMLVVVAHMMAATALSSASGALQAIGRMSTYGMTLLVERAVTLTAIVAVVGLARIDAVGALAVYALSGALVAGWAFRWIGARVLAPVRTTYATVAALWRFSLPVAASSWAGLLGTQWIDLVMLRYFLDLEAVGRYALASQLAGAILQIAVIVSTLLLPRFSVLAQRDPQRLRREVDRTLGYWLLAFSLGAAAAIPVAAAAVPLVFGGEFAGAVPALALLIVAASAAAIASTFQALLTAHGVMWPMTAAILASVVTNVTLNALLIPRLGLVGAAASTLGAYCLSAALMLWVVQRRAHGAALRYVLFMLPPAMVYVAWSRLDGPAFAFAALLIIVFAALALTRVFGLFREPDNAVEGGH